MHILYQLYRLLQIIGDTERKRLLKHYLRLGLISIHWLYKLLLHLTIDSCPFATGTPSRRNTPEKYYSRPQVGYDTYIYISPNRDS